MKVIKQLGPKCANHGEATDCLAGTSVVTGYLFGYIDEAQLRVVSYFLDYHPEQPLCRGQERMELAFKPVQSMTGFDVALLPHTVGESDELQAHAKAMGFEKTKALVAEMMYGLLPEEAVTVAMDMLQAEQDRMAAAALSA